MYAPSSQSQRRRRDQSIRGALQYHVSGAVVRRRDAAPRGSAECTAICRVQRAGQKKDPDLPDRNAVLARAAMTGQEFLATVPATAMTVGGHVVSPAAKHLYSGEYRSSRRCSQWLPANLCRRILQNEIGCSRPP